MRHSVRFGHLAIAFASWPAFLVSQPACWASGNVRWMGERRVAMTRYEKTVGWLVMLAVACRFIRVNKLNPRQRRLFRHPLVQWSRRKITYDAENIRGDNLARIAHHL